MKSRGVTQPNLGVNRIASADVLRVDPRDKVYSRKTSERVNSEYISQAEQTEFWGRLQVGCMIGKKKMN